MTQEKSEQEIIEEKKLLGKVSSKTKDNVIEEIINSVKTRQFRAYINNLTFNEDDWEDTFDTMREATEALNDALDDNGREDCEWGIENVKTYTENQVKLAVEKALEKGKELGILTNASTQPKSLAKGMRSNEQLIQDYIDFYLSKSYFTNEEKDSEYEPSEDEVNCLIWAYRQARNDLVIPIAELEKENRELKELVSEIHKNKCVCCENRQDQGAFAPLCMSCWRSKPYYNGVIKLKEDNEKLREQNSKLADEFEKNLKFIKSDSCIYRDNPRITIQIKALEKIIKRLRGEKD